MKMVPASRNPEDIYLHHEHPTIAGFMKRRRRKRAFPRVVKIKKSNFKLKRAGDVEKTRDFATETKIFGELRRRA